MINILEAKKILTKNIPLLPTENIPVSGSLGRMLACDVTSPIDVPSFDNSAMDGYAFCFQEEKNNYTVSTKIQAGDSADFYLKEGDAARIFTGAPIPKGADTVIQQELVSVQDNTIFFDEKIVQKGNHIRLRGAQCKAGSNILASQTLITPGVAALLSSVGVCTINVFRQPIIKVIITGNELVAPGKPLRDGEIYNSNQTAIETYLQLLGIKHTEFLQVKDDLKSLKTAVSSALNECDVLILSGGISVGEYDFVHQVLNEEGVQPLFYKVKQKPGKPLFAGKKQEKLVFALPGNPAAVISCFNQYLKPALQQMMGVKDVFANYLQLPLAHDWQKKSPLANILKAKVTKGTVSILSGQDSFNLQAFATANAFVLLHENDLYKCKGELVETFYW